VLLHLLLLEAAGFIERRTFLSHFTFDCSYRLEKKKSQCITRWQFVRSRRRGKDRSSLPPTVSSTTAIPLSNCSFLALFPLRTLQFVPNNKGGRCIVAWSNWNYCGDEKRGSKDSQTLEINMLSASCCCIWVSHHHGFILKHFILPPLSIFSFFFFSPPKSYTDFKGHIIRCVCFTCMEGWILPFKTTNVSGEDFQSQNNFFKIHSNPTLLKEVVVFQIHVMISVMIELRKTKGQENGKSETSRQ